MRLLIGTMPANKQGAVSFYETVIEKSRRAFKVVE